MKIIPLQIDDLKNILLNHFNYEKLYLIFEDAQKSELKALRMHSKLFKKFIVGEHYGKLLHLWN